MAYAMGDLDAFDALTHGIGFHVNKSARKDNLESDYNKIVQDATIHIRMVNDAINHQESEKAMELSKDSRMDDYMAIYMMDKNISNLRKMEQKSDDDGNFDKADELQQKIVEKMKEVINKYGKP